MTVQSEDEPFQESSVDLEVVEEWSQIYDEFTPHKTIIWVKLMQTMHSTAMKYFLILQDGLIRIQAMH